jgi:hypothetical protein
LKFWENPLPAKRTTSAVWYSANARWRATIVFVFVPVAKMSAAQGSALPPRLSDDHAVADLFWPRNAAPDPGYICQLA